MKTRKLKLVLLFGTAVATLPATIAVSCNEVIDEKINKTDTNTTNTTSPADEEAIPKTSTDKDKNTNTDNGTSSVSPTTPTTPTAPSSETSAEKETANNSTEETNNGSSQAEPANPNPQPDQPTAGGNTENNNSESNSQPSESANSANTETNSGSSETTNNVNPSNQPASGGESAPSSDNTSVTPQPVDKAAELQNAKNEANSRIDTYLNLSSGVIASLKSGVNSLENNEAIQNIVNKGANLNAKTGDLVVSLLGVENETRIANRVFESVKKAYLSALNNAQSLLTEGKLKESSTTVDQIEAVLNSLKAEIDNVNNADERMELHDDKLNSVKNDLGESNKTLGENFKKVLMQLVSSYINNKDQNHVENTIKVAELLKKLSELQTSVLEGLKTQTDYPRKYYNASNKDAYDTALRNALSIFPAYNFDKNDVYNSVTLEANNPRLFANARTAEDTKLENYVKLGENNKVLTEGANLQSTYDLVTKLNKDLKNEESKLNGDNNTEAKAYFKNPRNVELHWNNFLPKLVINTDYLSTTIENTNEASNSLSNGPLTDDQINKFPSVVENNKKSTAELETWFNNDNNRVMLTDALIKLLGSENINNVNLSSPVITYKHIYFKKNTNNNGAETRTVYSTPVVTFDVTAKEGFTALSSSEGNNNKLSINLSTIRKTNTETPYLYTSVYYTSTVGQPISGDVITTSKKYLNNIVNYYGPAIPLDASALASELSQSNTTILNKTVNGTSSITNTDFNDKFKNWLLKDNQSSPIANAQFRSVLRNYVHNYDNRYDLTNTSQSGNSGIFIAYPILNTPPTNGQEATEENTKNGYNLKLNEFSKLKESFYLQKIDGDNNAVYVPLQAKTSARWLRIFLVRIPLTKFIAPVTPIAAPSTATESNPEVNNAVTSDSANSGAGSTSTTNTGNENSVMTENSAAANGDDARSDASHSESGTKPSADETANGTSMSPAPSSTSSPSNPSTTSPSTSTGTTETSTTATSGSST
ncbi:hypothetical protein ACJA23_01060 [Mycoplasma corogypsi]|uniref:hypothetical protein n=1 Tax=Mycoplasma corogypsi TaxID=2106 RepID=UPI00387396F7